MKLGMYIRMILLFVMTGSAVFSFGQKTIALDNWFNRETHAKTGKIFHYTWDDTENSGFSIMAQTFRDMGASLLTLETAPAAQNLKTAGVYIIVDPDTISENPDPNYVQPADIKAIEKWVRKGGVLVLMSNDKPNAEFTHFNRLASVFGFRFRPVTLNPVEGRNWDMGAETVFPDHPLFRNVRKIYMKETTPIVLDKNARPLVRDNGDGEVFIAETGYGKGYVLAIGDPWLYNEYVDNRRLTSDFDNDKALVNFCSFLVSKAKR